MEKPLKVDDVVWAKVRNYPWWPAIVRIMKITEINDRDSENLQYRVDFISENTHHYLPKKKLKIFEGNVELPSEKKQTAILHRAIIIAHKINCGELQREDLYNLNLTFFSKHQENDLPKKRQSKEDEKKSKISFLDKKIEEMTKNCNFLPEDSGFLENLPIVKKIEKKLFGFLSNEVRFEEVTKNDVLEIFEKFVDYEPHEEILNHPHVLKALKYFYKEFVNSEDYQLVLLAKIANRLYLHWRHEAFKESLNLIKENDRQESSNDEESPRKRRTVKEEGTKRGRKRKEESEESEDSD